MLENLIYDRTGAEVTILETAELKGWQQMTAEERTQWLNAVKGAYNYTDLNRVEGAVLFLQGYLNGLQETLDAFIAAQGLAPGSFFEVPFEPFDLTTVTDWTMQDVPRVSDMARYLGNVDTITDALPITKALPATMNKLRWAGANEIERALSALYTAAQKWLADKEQAAQNAAAAWFYSGEIYGGEV